MKNKLLLFCFQNTLICCERTISATLIRVTKFFLIASIEILKTLLRIDFSKKKEPEILSMPIHWNKSVDLSAILSLKIRIHRNGMCAGLSVEST